MREILQRQRKAVRKARREQKILGQMLFIVDDLADDKRTMGCQLIRELLLRGRHSWVSTILSTQKMRAIDHACRLQFTGIFQFQCRSKRDWEVVLAEFAASIDPQSLQEMYDIATSDEYGFLFLNLQQHRFPRLQVRIESVIVVPMNSHRILKRHPTTQHMVIRELVLADQRRRFFTCGTSSSKR